MNALPNHPQLIGNYAPIQGEIDAPDLIVREGKLPESLNGILYRNSSNAMFPPLTNDHHWFLAEGMVHAVSVRDGRASYRNRWVRTTQYQAQREAGRRLVATGLVDPSPAEGANIPKHFAATHALVHGGRLLALDEWCGPAALDPETLETTSETWNFSGKHQGAFTAHPKVDPTTGEMLGFGYQAAGFGSPVMSFSVISPKGELTRHDRFNVPFCSVAHDFGITDEHVIFPLFPVDINLERAAKGGPLGAYNPELGTHFGIMGRNADVSTMRWFKGDPCYAFHTMNAFTERKNGRTKVVLDMMKMPHLPLFPKMDGTVPRWIQDGNGLLVRWTFDLDSNDDSYTEEVLTDLTGEFCTIDERYTGKPYTYGFYAACKSPWVDGASYDTISQINTVTGERRDYQFGPGQYVSEPIFTPRSAAAPEGDGYLMAVVYDSSRHLSDFVVLDTEDIRRGPVARVELPTRVPYSFHGSWHSRA